MRPIRFKTSTAVVVALACIGCVSEEEMQRDRPPPEVGGRFSIGGFSAPTSDHPYGYEGELSAEELALRERSRRFDRTVWQGVLLGAVAGTVIGAVAGGDAEDAVGGAIIGASLGAIAGIYVASKQEQFADLEDQIESMTRDVRKSNEEAKALIASAKLVLAEARRRLVVVNRRLAEGKATQKVLQQERARAWGNRKVVEKAVQGGRDQQVVFESAKRSIVEKGAPASDTRALEAELQDYQRNLATLDEIAAQMGKA
jgi:outer membrane lipoprotein SlyB